MNFYNKITSIRLAQGYSDVAAPGAGGSDPAGGNCISNVICNTLVRVLCRIVI